MEWLLPRAGEFLKQSCSKIVLLQAKQKCFQVYTKHVAQLGWCFSTDDHKNKRIEMRLQSSPFWSYLNWEVPDCDTKRALV